MKKVIKISSVQNKATGEVGSLYLIASVDATAYHNDMAKYYGLSVFFETEDGNKEYIKSFVFTKDEVQQFRIGASRTMQDISYFLSVQDTMITILDLGSAYIPDDSVKYAEKIMANIYNFEILRTEEGCTRLLAEQEDDPRRKRCGFRLAISHAFKNGKGLNITDDSIIPSTFPKECTIDNFNYNI